MSGTEEDRAPAVVRAEDGANAWRDAARHQRRAPADHADFYALACDALATLHALEDLTRVLHEQVAGYAHGRAVYDDTRQVHPVARLAQAAAELETARAAIGDAAWAVNRFWSAIGHIGVEEAP